MIRKEYKETRYDGRDIYRTYSDEGKRIIQAETGVVYDEAVDVVDYVYEETAEPIIDVTNAPMSYEEIEEARAAIAEAYRLIAEKEAFIALACKTVNEMELTDSQSLELAGAYPAWEDCVNKTMVIGYITRYEGRLYRARQTHLVLEAYPPSIYTAALYEVIEKTHEGTIEDPIPYAPPMEVFNGKHYEQYGILYRCTRDSGTALTHDLSALVGLYVEKVN